LASRRVVALLSGCDREQATSTPTRSLATTFHAEKLAELDAVIAEAIAQKRCPGGVLWVEREGVAYHRAYGHRAIVPAAEPMTEDTIFDAASLTKVVACTPSILLLVERGKIGLDTPVSRYLPSLRGDGKDAVAIRHAPLLRPAGRHQSEAGLDWRQAAIRLCCAETVTADRERVVYATLVPPVRRGGAARRRRAARSVRRRKFSPLHERYRLQSARRQIWSHRAAGVEGRRGAASCDPRARRMGWVAGAGRIHRLPICALRPPASGGELDGFRYSTRDSAAHDERQSRKA
jgi:hypothetical protein